MGGGCVVSLIAQSPAAGLLPRTVGGVILTEVDLGPVTLVAPFKGQTAKVNAALKKALGLALPAPGQVTAGKGGTRAIWVGPGRALVCGAAVPDLAALAAVVDQSDASAVVRVEGAAVTDVLARLVPIDLRPAAFPEGTTARTLIGHMMASVTRVGPDAIELMVFRSMAGTLVRELTEHAQGVAARAALG
jgi:heterotetrameric sarcosine oxidase gamma subunit